MIKCEIFPCSLFFFPLSYLASTLIMPIIVIVDLSHLPMGLLEAGICLAYLCIHTLFSTKSFINVVELNATSGQTFQV